MVAFKRILFRFHHSIFFFPLSRYSRFWGAFSTVVFCVVSASSFSFSWLQFCLSCSSVLHGSRVSFPFFYMKTEASKNLFEALCVQSVWNGSTEWWLDRGMALFFFVFFFWENAKCCPWSSLLWGGAFRIWRPTFQGSSRDRNLPGCHCSRSYTAQGRGPLADSSISQFEAQLLVPSRCCSWWPWCGNCLVGFLLRLALPSRREGVIGWPGGILKVHFPSFPVCPAPRLTPHSQSTGCSTFLNGSGVLGSESDFLTSIP